MRESQNSQWYTHVTQKGYDFHFLFFFISMTATTESSNSSSQTQSAVDGNANVTAPIISPISPLDTLVSRLNNACA